MDRYVCIHGHFYQPPRENPWLEAIEFQDSAYPYHDWNERITAECYGPNAAARILDSEEHIVHIVNNYARISFNFGPTLLAWMEERAPEVYRAILRADRESQSRFSGHGNALAQPYNHMILPLANARDKRTQVIWGIRDFQERFKRRPEGMWLPETAVDLESLEIMAEQEIRFTILEPHQAARVRPIGSQDWLDVREGGIDPTMPYRLRLPSGRDIALFFYNGPIAQAVAFEGLLAQGQLFAERLVGAFSKESASPQLVHIAADGETYGHHHRFGDMALAYALHHVESNGLARLTNYPEYLEQHPPTHEVEIVENTSWSCAHGVERWRADCGCSAGGKPGWSQQWRAPLREALDWLRDTLAPRFEEHLGELLRDPWAARDDYIEVVLSRSPGGIEQFLGHPAGRELNQEERRTALKLLELQRNALLMYTSCGWFFSEISGIETVQVLRYAARALQLAQEVFSESFEGAFLDLLGGARSNVEEYRDGRLIYENLARPAIVDLPKVGAHYAICSLFGSYPEQTTVYCYDVQREDSHRYEAGKTRLGLGRVRVRSLVTLDEAVLSYGVLHFGDHNLTGGVRPFRGPEAYQAMVDEVSEVFTNADLPETLRRLDDHFGTLTYSIRSLFKDDQRRLLDSLLETALQEAGVLYHQLFEHHGPLIRFLTDVGAPVPRALHAAAEVALAADLEEAISGDGPGLEQVRAHLEEARACGVELDAAGLAHTLELAMERRAETLLADPSSAPLLEQLTAVVDLARMLPFEVDLWRTQNIYFRLLHTAREPIRAAAEQGDEGARAWEASFQRLGEKLGVRVGV